MSPSVSGREIVWQRGEDQLCYLLMVGGWNALCAWAITQESLQCANYTHARLANECDSLQARGEGHGYHRGEWKENERGGRWKRKPGWLEWLDDGDRDGQDAVIES